MSALVLLAVSCSQYRYETVKGDPLKTKIYTLDNGLKVYMSVNKEKPRIQANIAVRVGGKNDPAQTTGLAHYFEHLMFKGTQQFGTSDYEAEKPLLDEIEALVGKKNIDRLDTVSVAYIERLIRIFEVRVLGKRSALQDTSRDERLIEELKRILERKNEGS